jgi:hypothetical protein
VCFREAAKHLVLKMLGVLILTGSCCMQTYAHAAQPFDEHLGPGWASPPTRPI